MKDNVAASNFWSQLFERAASDPHAALMNPEYDESADRARFRSEMGAAGWSDIDIDLIEAEQLRRRSAAPVLSPGVNRDVESAMAQLADDVEAAMARMGFSSHARVALGIEPHSGPSAAKIAVIATDESVITVSAFLFRFCGLIARAFTRTLRLNPWFWEAVDYNQPNAIIMLRRSPALVEYWMRIYFSFAVSGTHAGVPLRPSSPSEVLLMEQIARAMEIFAIAHEYGHHHLAHGRKIDADLRAQEFEADQFALRVCEEVGRIPVILENPYLLSGAGGTVLLMAFDTLRAIDALLGTPITQSSTHPSALERTSRFDTVKLLQPSEFARLRGFRTASSRIMALVKETLTSSFASLPQHEREEMLLLREQIGATLDPLARA